MLDVQQNGRDSAPPAAGLYVNHFTAPVHRGVPPTRKGAA